MFLFLIAVDRPGPGLEPVAASAAEQLLPRLPDGYALVPITPQARHAEALERAELLRRLVDNAPEPAPSYAVGADPGTIRRLTAAALGVEPRQLAGLAIEPGSLVMLEHEAGEWRLAALGPVEDSGLPLGESARG